MKKTNFNYNNNLTELKNWYVDKKREAFNQEKKFKVKLSFKIPVYLHYSKKRSDDKFLNEHTVKKLFFLGKNGCSNCEGKEKMKAKTVCYVSGRARTSGYRLSNFKLNQLKKVVFVSRELKRTETKEYKVKKVLKARHPNAWQNLTFKRAMKMAHNCGDYRKTYIKSKFSDFVIEELKKAFANKTKYSYKKYGKRRDYSVETKLCKDGVFRAWYSSEYAGCANGDYYVLLNPKVAGLKETD